MKIVIDGFDELEEEVGHEEAMRQLQADLRAAADVVGEYDRLGRRVFIEADRDTGQREIQIVPAETEDDS